MNKASITLAAALAALSASALGADKVATPPGAPKQVQSNEQQRKQLRQQEQKHQQVQPQSPAAQQKAKQIEMTPEHAIKKRIGPGPVA